MRLKLAVLSIVFGAAAMAQTMSNNDLIKLSKAGLSEDFILNTIDAQGSRLSTDVSSLVELKDNGVSERVLSAIVRKNPSSEPLNSDSIIRLVRAGFSENFVLDLMDRQPGKFSASTRRIIEMKEAGVSERILSRMVVDASTREVPAGTQLSVRLIDSVDSDRNREGDEFRASIEDPIMVNGDTVAPRGTDARVRLVQEKSSGKFAGKAELTVEVVSVSLNGKTVPVNTSSVSEYSKSQGASTAKKAAAVGAVGAIIGAIAGGGKGAAIGAGAGAAAGAGSGVFMHGQRVKIPSETLLTFTVQDPFKI